MFRQMCTGKIHLATVTETVLEYEGSIGIDRELFEAAGMLPFERVQVANVNTGDRLETYIIEAPAGSGKISLNGAAARLAQPGDRVIVIAYGLLTEQEARALQPKIVLVDGKNRIRKLL